MKMFLGETNQWVTGKLIVTVACPDADHAKRIARALVERQLAACVQIGPQMESVYRWKGGIETASETLITIKTVQDKWEELATTVVGMHPYEVPEILAVPVAYGLDAYLDWMDEELRSS